MANQKSKLNRGTQILNSVLTLVFSLISIAYVYPLFIMLVNSFKKKAYISRAPFTVPLPGTETWTKMFVGLQNYITGIEKTEFFRSFWFSLVITVLSVFVILLFCSMTAWYINRVTSKLSKGVYALPRCREVSSSMA